MLISAYCIHLSAQVAVAVPCDQRRRVVGTARNVPRKGGFQMNLRGTVRLPNFAGEDDGKYADHETESVFSLCPPKQNCLTHYQQDGHEKTGICRHIGKARYQRPDRLSGLLPCWVPGLCV